MKENENKKLLKRKERGITLIALVITIIVLLILAGVSIAMLTGQNGILTQAQKAKNETEKAAENEAAILNEYNQYLNNLTGGGTSSGGSIGSTDGSWSDEKGVNTPVIKDNNMELVKWDGSQFVKDDTNSSYDYSNQEWANAKVTIEGVESYFVWIPRYEYKITYYTDGNKATTSETPTEYGTIDIKFIPTSKTTADEGYIIHPAFTSDINNGGWNEELPGIWVGKYESSLVNKADSSNINTTSSTVGNIIVDSSNNTDKAIAVQPGMSSWRYCTIGNMYTSAKAYATNLNSHMLKNSEWGAVAYLTESKYGRDGEEVTINDNSSYITADAGISENPEQSSTGNETGIYDLSGGAYEYVAAYYNGSASSSLTNNGGSFASKNGQSTEYATAYTGTSASSAYKPGDATYETSGWYGDYASFVYSFNPFFKRGGDFYSGSDSGVFTFNNNYGNSDNDKQYGSFRVCLAVK